MLNATRRAPYAAFAAGRPLRGMHNIRKKKSSHRVAGGQNPLARGGRACFYLGRAGGVDRMPPSRAAGQLIVPPTAGCNQTDPRRRAAKPDQAGTLDT
jgi:hypothetical protein